MQLALGNGQTKHVTTGNMRHPSSPAECHSGPFLTRSQTGAVEYCDSALSPIIADKFEKVGQVNNILTKSETIVQVGCFDFLTAWIGAVKGMQKFSVSDRVC